MSEPHSSVPGRTIRVWDLPVRLFHWLLVICVAGAVVTMELMDSAADWHVRFGYGALALMIFRWIWGVAGDRYSRFSSFFFSPSQILAYMKGGDGASPVLGHNPLGSLSVWAMMLSVTVQAVTGLMSSDEIATDGPLAKHVSSAVVEQATKIHEINHIVLYALIALHVASIIFYRVARHKNLVGPMVTGDRELPADMAGAKPATDNAAIRLRALVIAAIAVAIVVWIATAL